MILVRVALSIVGALGLAVGVARAQYPPPRVTKTPEEIRAAVHELATAKNKLGLVDPLRWIDPAAVMADALVDAIASDPGFADGETRSVAYEALGTVGELTREGVILLTDKQVDQLVAGLKEQKQGIRATCARALGRVPEARRASVQAPLVGVLDDEWHSVTQSALSSLEGLKLPAPTPAAVVAIAFAPTPAMREKWFAADKRGSTTLPNRAWTSTEVSLRGLAMGVVASAEGYGALLDRDLSKDADGRRARALSCSMALMRNPGDLGVSDRQHGVLIAELNEYFREPGELREADRAAAMALRILETSAASEAVRKGAGDALLGLAKDGPGEKRELVQLLCEQPVRRPPPGRRQ